MDLDAYVREHDAEWRRLEQLIKRYRPSAPEVDELVTLYQRTSMHLSVVRSRTPDPILIARLSRLVLAARAAVTGGRRFSWRSVETFFTVSFPLEVYRARLWWITVAVLNVVLTGGLIRYFAANPDMLRLFMSDTEIDQIVRNDFVSYYSENHAHTFAVNVWTNNALLTAQVMAAGVLVLPVFYLLWANVFNTAIVGGAMVGHGRGDVFSTMLAPHGLLEITCVLVAAGIGLRVGWAWIAPGPLLTRGQALAARTRSAMAVALGLALVLGVAGLLEAFVTPSGLPGLVRVAIGAVVWIAFLGYVLRFGARAHARRLSADLDEEFRGADLPTT